MSKDLKKTLIYSLIPAIILFILSSFIDSSASCEAGSLCNQLAQKYYGYPLEYLDAKLNVISYPGIFVNFFAYYFISFTFLFIAQLVINLVYQKKHDNN